MRTPLKTFTERHAQFSDSHLDSIHTHLAQVVHFVQNISSHLISMSMVGLCVCCSSPVLIPSCSSSSSCPLGSTTRSSWKACATSRKMRVRTPSTPSHLPQDQPLTAPKSLHCFFAPCSCLRKRRPLKRSRSGSHRKAKLSLRKPISTGVCRACEIVQR